MATNLLPQLIPNRLLKARTRLRERLTTRSEPLAATVGPLLERAVPLAEAQCLPMTPIVPGTVFGPGHGSWHMRWFRVDVPAPRPGEEGRRHLRWDVQGEATAYLDGKPWAGLDVAHQHCPLPDHACTVWLECGLWVTAMWVPGARGIDAFGPRFDGVAVVVRDLQAWDAYWDLEALLQVLGRLYRRNEAPVGPCEGAALYKPPHERADPLLRMLLREADAAIDQLDRHGVPACHAALRDIYRRFRSPDWAPTAAMTGMAHIDVVWLWPERVAERKAIHAFATQLRLMERYPEYIFNQSQPAINRAIDRAEPALAAEIAQRIREGRWDLTGAFEVECDSILPCGEALARCLAIGQRQFHERTGAYSTLAWLPDAFGFSNVLPQVLQLGGVTRFYTTKLTWSAVSRFPYHSFVWRGADGSEVLAHACSSIYNQAVEADPLSANLDDHRQVDVHPEMLICVGWGDGGGGATEDQLERARRFADLAGMPKVRWSASEPFFDRLEAVRHRLPLYQGELYLEGTRGCFTTQAEMKRSYRRAETALQTLEAVRVLLGGAPVDEASWRRVAFYQFHDALPGSSIREVYDEAIPELQGISAAALAAAQHELATVAPATELGVVNPLPYARRQLVTVPRAAVPASIVAQDIDEHQVLVQLDVPALGVARLHHARTPVHPLRATPQRLENGVVQATFDAGGRMTGLIIAGEVQPVVAPAGLVLAEDIPGVFDAWEIDQAATRLGSPVVTDGPLTVVEHGPLRVAVSGRMRVGTSPATITYALEADSATLSVHVQIDWQERHRWLSFHLPTGYRGRFARFGAPFGATLRPQQAGVAADEAMWEVPGSRWAAVTEDGGRGLAIVSASSYGFACRDGELSLSLLRRSRFPATGNEVRDDPAFTDGGPQSLRFVVRAHHERWIGYEPSTAGAADAMFTPCLVAPVGPLPPVPWTLVEVGTLTPSWVLPAAAGGAIVRLHETAGSRGRLRLRSTSSRVVLVDLLERPLGEALVADAQGEFTIDYQPYQIVSIWCS